VSSSPSSAARAPESGRRSWRLLGGTGPAGVAIVTGWALVVGTASTLRVDDGVHHVALFVHLVSLVTGFGAVLVIEVHGLLWLTGRRTLGDVVHVADATEVLVWMGLLGLVVSGIFLEPDVESGMTRLKLLLVLAIGLNGLNAFRVKRRMTQLLGGLRLRDAPRPFLGRLALTTVVSQVAWWGAIVIGFVNSTR
jgi:hypothetical protein